MCAANVQMAVNNGRYRKSPVPIFRQFTAAPEGKAGDEPQIHQVVAQGVMVDEDDAAVNGRFREPFFCVATARLAPGLS